jgi:hypothetical protein
VADSSQQSFDASDRVLGTRPHSAHVPADPHSAARRSAKIDARTGLPARLPPSPVRPWVRFFTLALKNGNPTVVNVILNIQPVISTVGAFLLFGDRLTPRFFLYAALQFSPVFFCQSRST